MMHLQSQANNDADSTYSDPKDVVKFTLNDPPPEVPLRSPSVSPPPPPPSSPPSTNQAEGTGDELYDIVQPNKTTAKPPGVRGYDHLSQQMSGKYDRLTENGGTEEGGSGERQHSTPVPSLPEYSTVSHQREEEMLYATVGTEKTRGHNILPDHHGNAANNHTARTLTSDPSYAPQESQMYAVVDKSRKSKKAVAILPVTGGNGRHEEVRKPIVPSPPNIARGNRSASAEDHLYAVVNPAGKKKKKKKAAPPVAAKSPHSPVPPAVNGGGSPPEITRSLEHQRQSKKPPVGNGHVRHKSSDLSLVMSTAVVKAHSTEQLYPQHRYLQAGHAYHPVTVGEDLYALPVKKRPPVAPKPLPRRSPSPVAPPNCELTSTWMCC